MKRKTFPPGAPQNLNTPGEKASAQNYFSFVVFRKRRWQMCCDSRVNGAPGLRERRDGNQVTMPPRLETAPLLELRLWEMDDFGITEVLTSKKPARNVIKKTKKKTQLGQMLHTPLYNPTV